MTRGTAAAALGGRPGPRFTGATGFGGDCSVRGFFAFGADPAESSESSARICMSLFMTAVCCEGFIWLSSATTGLDCASDLCDPCGTCAWLVCGATACLVFSATICGFFVSTASAASDGLIPLAASAASRANFGAGAAPATKRVTPCMASSRRGRACAAVSDDVVRIRLLLYGGRLRPSQKACGVVGRQGWVVKLLVHVKFVQRPPSERPPYCATAESTLGTSRSRGRPRCDNSRSHLPSHCPSPRVPSGAPDGASATSSPTRALSRRASRATYAPATATTLLPTAAPLAPTAARRATTAKPTARIGARSTRAQTAAAPTAPRAPTRSLRLRLQRRRQQAL